MPIAPSRYSGWGRLYTDGSFTPGDHRIPSGFTVCEDDSDFKIAFQMTHDTGILRTELTALLHAVEHCCTTTSNTVIFTDSLTSIYLIRKAIHHPYLLRHHSERNILARIIQALHNAAPHAVHIYAKSNHTQALKGTNARTQPPKRPPRKAQPPLFFMTDVHARPLLSLTITK